MQGRFKRVSTCIGTDSWSNFKILNCKDTECRCEENEMMEKLIQEEDESEYIEEEKFVATIKSKDFTKAINIQKFAGRPSIRISINGVQGDALLDTGANINVIDSKFIKNIRIHQMKRTTLDAKCANGEGLKIIGKVTLETNLLNNIKQIDFYVVENMNPQILAGTPFMKEFQIELTINSIKNTIDTLTAEDTKIKKLMDNYESIFMKDKYDIGLTNLIKHKITTNGPPININPRRQPIHLQPKFDQTIQIY